jgi:hypothetical protein
MALLSEDKARRVNLAVAALVAAAAVYSIGWYIYSPLTRPSPADYEGVSSHLHALWQKGDVLAVVPFWAERIREYAGDLDVINPPDLVSEDLSRNARLWLLSVFGYAKDRDLLGTLSRKYRLSGEKRFGKLVLYLFDLPPPAKVSFDFWASIDKAKVTLQRGGDRKDCTTWRDGRWECANSTWEYVGRNILDIDDNPRQCIWAHPVQGAVLAVTYKDVPLSRRIVGNTGLTYIATRVPEGAPVGFEVLIDGRQALTTVNENRRGWNRFEIDTSSMAGTAHEVTFRVRTQRDGMRHFCFMADARD